MRTAPTIAACVAIITTASLMSACASGAQAQTPAKAAVQNTPSPTASLPTPGPNVVGPMSTTSTDKSFVTVKNVFVTMKKTVYSHHYVENTQTGYYAWDCVGMADWVLQRSAPGAWNAMHTKLNIRKGYVPNPTSWYSYLKGTLPPSWKKVTTVAGITPGTYILFPANTATKFVGHAVIAAGVPMKMSDGTYALRVFDSTGAPHGPKDSRKTDPRTGAVPPNTTGSGLGNGTMRILPGPGGTLAGMRWSVNAGGPAMTGLGVAAAVAVR